MSPTRRFILACAAAGGLAGVAHAEELRPIQGGSVTLGPLNGLVYYTESGDSFRVVATFSADVLQPPFRVTANLLPGQAVTLSIAGPIGSPLREVRLVREGEHLLLTQPATSAADATSRPESATVLIAAPMQAPPR